MNTLNIAAIRRMIERGYDDQTIVDMLDTFGAISDSQTDTGVVPRRVARQTVQTGGGTRQAPRNVQPFIKPDTTRTVYSFGAFAKRNEPIEAALDRLGVTGNQRAVADFIAANGGEADSREIRANVLREKLHADGVTNKSIESAVHALKTRTPAILVASDKPANGNGNGEAHTPVVAPKRGNTRAAVKVPAGRRI